VIAESGRRPSAVACARRGQKLTKIFLRLEAVQRSIDFGENFHMSIYCLLAKIGFDTAENEICKVFPLSV
jgi:hypothetical protein